LKKKKRDNLKKSPKRLEGGWGKKGLPGDERGEEYLGFKKNERVYPREKKKGPGVLAKKTPTEKRVGDRRGENSGGREKGMVKPEGN